MTDAVRMTGMTPKSRCYLEAASRVREALIRAWERVRTPGAAHQDQSRRPLTPVSSIALLVLLLYALAWSAHFYWATTFGFYWDDWWHFANRAYLPPLTPETFFKQIQYVFTHFPSGRPLQYTLYRATAPLIGVTNSLVSLYIIAASVVVINAFLLYVLVRQQFGNRIGVASAILFILLPIDATRQFLTHMNIHLSLALALTAMVLLLSGLTMRRPFAYIILLISTFLYEAPFFLSLAVPVINWVSSIYHDTGSRRQQRIITCLWDYIVILSAGLTYYVLRTTYSPDLPEHRSIELSVGYVGQSLDAVVHYLATAAVGIWTSVSRFDNWSLEIMGPVIVVLACAAGCRTLENNPGNSASLTSIGSERALPLWTAAIMAVVLAALGLSLSVFFYDRIPLEGRGSRVFIQALPGLALLLAIAGEISRRIIASRSLLGRFVHFCIVVFVLIQFGVDNLVNQTAYSNHWESRQSEYHELSHVMGQLQSGDRIALVGDGWSDPVFGTPSHQAIENLFQYENKPNLPPPHIVHVPRADWWQDIQVGPGGQLHWANEVHVGFKYGHRLDGHGKIVPVLKGDKIVRLSITAFEFDSEDRPTRAKWTSGTAAETKLSELGQLLLHGGLRFKDGAAAKVLSPRPEPSAVIVLPALQSRMISTRDQIQTAAVKVRVDALTQPYQAGGSETPVLKICDANVMLSQTGAFVLQTRNKQSTAPVPVMGQWWDLAITHGDSNTSLTLNGTVVASAPTSSTQCRSIEVGGASEDLEIQMSPYVLVSSHASTTNYKVPQPR